MNIPNSEKMCKSWLRDAQPPRDLQQLITGCCFREGCLLPNAYITVTFWGWAMKQWWENKRVHVIRHLSPCYFNDRLWPAELLKIGSTSLQREGLQAGQTLRTFFLFGTLPRSVVLLWALNYLNFTSSSGYVAYTEIIFFVSDQIGFIHIESHQLACSWLSPIQNSPDTEEKIFILSSFWRSSRTLCKRQWKEFKAPYASSWLKTHRLVGLSAAKMGWCCYWAADELWPCIKQALVAVLKIMNYE